MLDNSNIRLIYSKIQKQLFYMIPEKWDSIYLYASIIERIHHLETGELFFYYFPKSIWRKNPINSYEIPSRFKLDEEGYIKLAENLYLLIKQLRREYQKAGERVWANLTIKVEKFHFVIEFSYDDLNDEEEKRLIWSYQNLKIPLESYTKREKKIILEYLEQEKTNKIEKYSEPMYRNPIKNVIQYNRNQTGYVTQEQLDKVQQKEYTYKKKQNKSLKQTKIVKSEFEEVKKLPGLKLEEQIEAQKQAVKSQILNKSY